MTAAFAQDGGLTGKTKWRKIAGRPRPKVPRLAALTDAAEADVLAS